MGKNRKDPAKGKKSNQDRDVKPRHNRTPDIPTEYVDHEMLQIRQMLARQRGNNFCHCGTEYSAELKQCPVCA
jgi:hypothetical protein